MKSPTIAFEWNKIPPSVATLQRSEKKKSKIRVAPEGTNSLACKTHKKKMATESTPQQYEPLVKLDELEQIETGEEEEVCIYEVYVCWCSPFFFLTSFFV